MWLKGFNILQNIENREMIESSRKKIEDEMSEKIKNRYAMPRPRHEGKPKKAEENDQ